MRLNQFSRFGELLKLLRQEHKLTQRDLANKSGIHASVICNFENGRALGPTSQTIKRIGEAIGASTRAIEQLEVLAKIDRLEKIFKEQIPEQALLLQMALDASSVLTKSEQQSLTAHLAQLIESRKQFPYLATPSCVSADDVPLFTRSSSNFKRLRASCG